MERQYIPSSNSAEHSCTHTSIQTSKDLTAWDAHNHYWIFNNSLLQPNNSISVKDVTPPVKCVRYSSSDKRKKETKCPMGVEGSTKGSGRGGGGEKRVRLAKCVLCTDWDASRLIALGPAWDTRMRRWGAPAGPIDYLQLWWYVHVIYRNDQMAIPKLTEVTVLWCLN